MLEHFNALRDDRSFLFLCLLPLICIVLQAVSPWERECREDWQSPGSERIWGLYRYQENEVLKGIIHYVCPEISGADSRREASL